MSLVLKKHFEQIKRPRVLVVGDIILDHYVWGSMDRISPEAPVGVLNVREDTRGPGGAGNVAANLASLGACVRLAGVVGDDEAGSDLRATMKALKIDTGCVVAEKGRPTTRKTRLMAHAQQIVRVDREDSSPIAKKTEAAIMARIRACIANVQSVILSDYAKGVVTPTLSRAVIALATSRKIPVIVDPKGSDYSRYKGAFAITPNRKEAEEATGIKLRHPADVKKAAKLLLDRLGLAASILTLGADGMACLEKNGVLTRVPTCARDVYDVTGAGDTAVATLGFALAGKIPVVDAVRIANAAAGIVVGKVGAVAVRREELAGALSSGEHPFGDKILPPAALATVVAALKKDGKRIVMTNGCFDILHPGHVVYLKFARGQGDVLVVALNSDRSVRKIKGPKRPILREEERAIMLAALGDVDYVTLFNETTPAKIIERITPDVLVKGEDWRDKGVVGRAHVEKSGGRVALAKFMKGKSTTDIIKRVLEKHEVNGNVKK